MSPASAASCRAHLTVVILTRDEERHIARAIASVAGIAARCFVIDSGSTDRTIEIARDAGAAVLENAWLNYATQFNWALKQLPDDTEWVLRLDADEYLEPALADQICRCLHKLAPRIMGVYIPRRMVFLGRRIRHGGVFPIWVLRLFRHGKGRCENRWMDEHIIVEGEASQFGAGELIDHNHNSLTWWTSKHNAYASREVIDLLNLEYAFMPHETVADLSTGKQAGVKRWIKERLYARLSIGIRAFLYFFYRFIIRLGFLDGREGVAFHVLQGFWYRYLVDMKLYEVRSHINNRGVDVKSAIESVLGIRLDD